MIRLTHQQKSLLEWIAIALMALLFAATVAGAQENVRPRTWLEVGPQELQRDNLGSVFPGPALMPGPHMVWVAAKQNDTAYPYRVWRSYGPFDVAAGQTYLVTVSGAGEPTVAWRTWQARSNDDPEAVVDAAAVYYLNQNEGDRILGVTVVPATERTPNLVISDVLSAEGPREPRYYGAHKAHDVFLEGGKTYIVGMTSGAFDSYLMIEDENGVLLAQNDEESTMPTNGALKAHIAFHAPVSGTYRLIATTYAPDREGDYVITVREVPVMMHADDELAVGDEARNDCFLKTYDVPMTEGRRYYIDLESREFLTSVKLLNPEGLVVAFDEGGVNANTRIRFQPPMPGPYRIVVTSATERSIGAFSLTVREDE